MPPPERSMVHDLSEEKIRDIDHILGQSEQISQEKELNTMCQQQSDSLEDSKDQQLVQDPVDGPLPTYDNHPKIFAIEKMPRHSN